MGKPAVSLNIKVMLYVGSRQKCMVAIAAILAMHLQLILFLPIDAHQDDQ